MLLVQLKLSDRGLDVSKVDQLMDDMQELYANQEDIAAALGQNTGGFGVFPGNCDTILGTKRR